LQKRRGDEPRRNKSGNVDMNRIGINFNFGDREQPAIDVYFCGGFGSEKAVNASVSFVGNKAFFPGQDGFKNVRRQCSI
jgi:hypothetical protein